MSQGATTGSVDLTNIETSGPKPPAADDALRLTREQEKERDREIFRRLQADAGAESEEPPAPSAPKPNSPAPSGTSTPTRGEPAGNAPDPAEARELEVIAKSVLRRDGMGEEEQTALFKSMPPEKLKAYVAKRQRVQADQDRLGNEAAELKRKTAGKGKKEEVEPEGDDAADDLADLTPKQRATVSKLRQEGEDERAQEVLDAIRETAPAGGSGGQARGKPPGRAPVDDGLEPEERATINENRILKRFQEPLDQLAATYPKLKDEGERRKLVRRADRLLQANAVDIPEGANAIETIFRAAAGIQYGTPDPTAAQRKLIERSSLERNGQPDASETRRQPAGKLTGKDRDREAYRLLQSGKSPDEIPRLLDLDR